MSETAETFQRGQEAAAEVLITEFEVAWAAHRPPQGKGSQFALDRPVPQRPSYDVMNKSSDSVRGEQ